VRILVACYTVLAIAAGARAAVQLATGPSADRTPYVLSAVAALVYVVLAVSLRRGGRWQLLALAAAIAELGGVLAVGTSELSGWTEWPDETVWSGYGVGYGFAPLVLPIAAAVVLIRRLRSDGERYRPRLTVPGGGRETQGWRGSRRSST
jgi:hypothetical protein